MIRLAAGLGFYGDAWEPVAAAIERGAVDVVCSDHLAELTLAILRKDQMADPSAGYTRDLVPMLTELWPLAAPRGVKFVLNAGGLNPAGAARALAAAFDAKGFAATIAVVAGDALLDRIDELRSAGESLAHADSGAELASVRERLVFANAYLGAAPIAQALAQGADIVLTGRVADAALSLGPLVHHFGWPLAPVDQAGWDRLAQGIAVGHLLECSGQGSGGNFGSARVWQQVPDLGHIGYPIAEVAEDGSAVITKAEGTGGRINVHTLRQQLLYEVHDPRAYLTPDVVLDMSTLVMEEVGRDRLRIAGATGRPPPSTLKVVAGYTDGWLGEATVGFCWPDAMAKARAVVESVKVQLAERRLAHEALQVEFIGHDTFLGPHANGADVDEANEVWLRLALRCADRRAADAFPRLFPWMALSGPPFMGGFRGVQPARQLLGLWPAAVRREHIDTNVRIELVRTGASR